MIDERDSPQWLRAKDLARVPRRILALMAFEVYQERLEKKYLSALEEDGRAHTVDILVEK